MSEFKHTTARVAAWNLAGYGGIPEERLLKQVEGLALLDAEVIALVEISPQKEALSGRYPPGSTVKPFIGLGGLETGTIAFDSSKYCPGTSQPSNISSS